VMCVHQVFGRGPQEPVSYERGRPMPLFRGATSKIILAHLAPRTLKSLFEANRSEIAEAGFGPDWEAFRSSLASIRRAGFVVTRGEIDRGRVGIAVPIFDSERAILGSLSFALSASRSGAALIDRLAPLLATAARKIETGMNQETASRLSPARLRVAR
jgi:DNA-binding IclR family transcriptional regulator